MKKPKKTIHERVEKLKKQAEKEGMKLVIEFSQQVNQNWSEPTFTATNVKDEWEGVEFVTGIFDKNIYVLIKNHGDYLTFRDINGKINETSIESMFPSTESAYIEQLKAKAFELFGEIKEGDRFERGFEAVSDKRNVFAIGDRKYAMNGFFYKKEIDTLHFNGHSIYSKGKWAKRVKERIKVKNWSYRTYEKDGQNYHECTLIVPVKEFSDDVHIFLTSKLEEYLNS